jgi:hypothetical protein
LRNNDWYDAMVAVVRSGAGSVPPAGLVVGPAAICPVLLSRASDGAFTAGYRLE